MANFLPRLFLMFIGTLLCFLFIAFIGFGAALPVPAVFNTYVLANVYANVVTALLIGIAVKMCLVLLSRWFNATDGVSLLWLALPMLGLCVLLFTKVHFALTDIILIFLPAFFVAVHHVASNSVRLK